MIVTYSNLRGARLCEGDIFDSYDEVENLGGINDNDIETMLNRWCDGENGDAVKVKWWRVDDNDVDLLRYLEHVKDFGL